MMLCAFGVVGLVLILCHGPADGGLTLSGVQCGQRSCSYGDYCSDIDHTCKPCSTICNSSTHNYEETLCVKDCQDYLHDVRYVQKDENDSGSTANLKATVQRLSHMVTVNLVLVCFMLVILSIVLIFQLYRWMNKKHITFASIKAKLFPKKSEGASGKTTVAGKPDLRLDMPTPSAQSVDSPATMTTSISRRPAEDSTLDYAYDNPAMATPSPNNKPNESAF